MKKIAEELETNIPEPTTQEPEVISVPTEATPQPESQPETAAPTAPIPEEDLVKYGEDSLGKIVDTLEKTIDNVMTTQAISESFNGSAENFGRSLARLCFLMNSEKEVDPK